MSPLKKPILGLLAKIYDPSGQASRRLYVSEVDVWISRPDSLHGTEREYFIPFLVSLQKLYFLQ
jgi:hypothetical protein